MPLYTCSLCGEHHGLRQCQHFLNMNLDARFFVVYQHNHCWKCLAQSHNFRQCTSKYKCQKCRRGHHTLLHDPAIDALYLSNVEHQKPKSRSSNNKNPSSSNVSTSSQQPLTKALINIDRSSSRTSKSSQRPLTQASTISNRSSKRQFIQQPTRGASVQRSISQASLSRRSAVNSKFSPNDHCATREDSMEYITHIRRLIKEVIRTLQML